MTRVAVDAMGGDFAPAEIVAGSVAAHRDLGIPVVLVGREPDLKEALTQAGADPDEGLEVVHAADVIAMDDPDPARAVRAKRDASVVAATRLVREGRADAVFSAGSTGAAMAAAVVELGRIRGVGRPAVAVVLPFPDSPTVLVDAGANADVRPEHLSGFAVLGSVLAETSLGIAEPRVGLLNVGEEPGKGSELARAAYPLIESAGLRFVGNVEGRDIPGDRVDVVVTDGFTGNVALKLMEGFATFLMNELVKVFFATEESTKAAEVLMPGLLELRTALSPESRGGAQLLGVKGVCIIGHGSSRAPAVRAAVEVASQTAQGGLVGRIAGRLERGPGGRT